MKIIPSPPALAAGLALAAAFTGLASAQAADDLAVEGNTIIRAYSLYCDPTYYDAHKLGDGRWNPDQVESYGRTLLIRYNANCNTFWARGVAPAEAAYQLSQTVPELQRDGGGVLTDRQAQALGKQLWIDAFYDRYGCNQRQGADQRVAYDRVLAPHWQKVGASDAHNLGIGYATLEVLRVAMGVDPNESADMMCSLAIGFFSQFTIDVINGGLASSEEIDAAMPAPDEPASPKVERQSNGPSVPSPNLDGNSNVADVLTSISGWWHRADLDADWACADDPANKNRIAIGLWSHVEDGIAFGTGEPKIGFYDYGCTITQPEYWAESIFFNAQCTYDDGEPYSGKGEIGLLTKDRISVSLPGQPDWMAFDLRACPAAEQATVTPPARKGAEVEQWVPFGAVGWSIELPANLADGPQEAIIEKGKDIGTAFMDEDSSESLITFAADLGDRPIQYLEARYAGPQYTITYRFDRKAVAVMSGYLGEEKQQTFYAKCIPAAGGRCFELVYDTKDGDRMSPVVERISKSFKVLP